MRIAQSLVLTAGTLSEAGIPDASLEAEVLLRHVLGLDRAGFWASIQQRLPTSTEDRLHDLVDRRTGSEPLAYITGHREFYGLDFFVDSSVLIPRQETELLVDRALDFCSTRGPEARPRIADVGTGSGAIAVAIARHAPNATLYATDLSPSALAMADVNRHRHGVAHRVHLFEGDLLDALPCPAVDLVVSNPPYIRTDDIPRLAPEVRREPRSSLDGGADGLYVMRRLLSQAHDYVRPGGRVLLEVSPEQLDAVRDAATRLLPGAQVSFHRDLLGLPRVVEVQFEGAARNRVSPQTGASA